MAWTYWTAELSSGDVLALEMVREWCAALQERYRALLGNSTAVVRMRGGSNGDHRIPLNLMIETSEDGATFTARTPHGAFAIVSGGWVKESDLDSTGTATAEDFASALTGLGFTKAELEASWVTSGVMSAKYWNYLRRVVQLMKVLPVEPSVTDPAVYIIVSGDPEYEIFDPRFVASNAADTTDWNTVRSQGTLVLPTLAHVNTATALYLSASSLSQANSSFTPGFTHELTVGTASVSITLPASTGSAFAYQDRYWKVAYGGGYSSALDLRPSNYGAYAADAINPQALTELTFDAYIAPAWTYP